MTKFSYQLYCSRNYPPLSETLAMVASAGYERVEGYGGLYANPALVAELKANLAQHGLHMASGHFSLDMLENQRATVLDIARTFDMKAIYCPHIMPDQRPKDAAGWVEFGRRLQETGKPYKDAGYDFGWHNHDFEFRPLPDGSIPQERMFEGGPDLSWEGDIAWVVKGGGDPLAWIEKFRDRITAAHIKDIAPAGQCLDEDGWADVGHGTMDWPTIMKALRGAGVELFVMEHDNPSDDRRFATRSIAAARKF
jgi:sugar phosphate isomerase/epimerase